MKINLAVYTATEGFDWQPGSAYTRSELNKYKEKIGRFPDILMEKVPYGGIFVCDGKLVFYRMHIFLRGDSRGRDALYCVLGAIPLEAGRKISLSRVFATPEFRAPMRPFPVSIEVEESQGVKIPSTWEELEEGLAAPQSSAHVGVYATFFSRGTFFCRLDGSAEKPTPHLTYKNCDLKPAFQAPPPRASDAGTARPAPMYSSGLREPLKSGSAGENRNRREVELGLNQRRLIAANQTLKNIIIILGALLAVTLAASVGVSIMKNRSAEAARTEARQQIEAGERKLRDTQETLKSHEQQAAKLEDELRASNAMMNQNRNQLSSRDLELSELRQDLKKSNAELNNVRSELADTKTRLRQKEADCQKLKNQLDAAKGELEKVRQKSIEEQAALLNQNTQNESKQKQTGKQPKKTPADPKNRNQPAAIQQDPSSVSPEKDCPACKGEGSVRCRHCGGQKYVKSRCPSCNGHGRVSGRIWGDRSCPDCQETGWVPGRCPTCESFGMGKIPCLKCQGNGHISVTPERPVK
jgi:hypothetical protein